MPDKQRWDDLQAFLAIARSGRLTEAARLLGVEHTTLSRRLIPKLLVGDSRACPTRCRSDSMTGYRGARHADPAACRL